MMVIVYTANNLPFNALLSRMTLDVQDRASAAAMRFVMTQITTIITNAITAKLLASVGWRTLSIIYAIVAMILSALCFAGVKEHVGEDESGSVCMIVGSIVVGIAGSAFALAMVGLCIRGAGIGFIFSSLFAATADVVDYGEWKFGIRSEGLVNSCTSFGMKLGIGFGLAMGSWIIAFE